MTDSNPSTLIIGAGKSGLAAEALLQSEGMPTSIFDEQTHTIQNLEDHCEVSVIDQAIISPGFSLTHPWCDVLRQYSIPLCSEIELGWSRFKGKTIAVTGSNGKSSTVKWITEILKLIGDDVVLGGNYGIPASEVVLKNAEADWLVLEVSSFQLETVRKFSPTVGILLNLLPNHLDRHDSIDAYTAIKGRIFGPSFSSETHAILPLDLMDSYEKELKTTRSVFNFGTSSIADYVASEGVIEWQGQPLLDLRGTHFSTSHLLESSGAAVATLMHALEIDMVHVRKAALLFQGLSHRFEQVGIVHGVTCLNDSKATNLAAMAAAVRSCQGKVHLLAGGLLKESDLTFVKEILVEKVSRLYVFGESAFKMKAAWGDAVACSSCSSLKEAFELACKEASSGESLLLSPGCASFDQFGGFEDRGDQFRSLVSRWKEKVGVKI
ncbi:MAG TPA: UDP-N-acetylmuramoyl-L-alanine--D-glutamate ligase [Verrucomicrobia bacterium]|nr:UDP-N-acetylmuramoyl-L-alanine--D-glutamate ligase [Kiritimatiellaceae bacterium]HBO88158.1 UDP-N-acetylmuramoyl-L-alanine--D-glutamate ligase [Verrucomicrobiota bacterium]